MIVQNICKGICKMHFYHKICIGCYRTRLEIITWHKGTEEQKIAIIEKTDARKQAVGELV